MTTEEQKLVGDIVDRAVVNLSFVPNANTVALNPDDFRIVQKAFDTKIPSIIAGDHSLKVVEDSTVSKGSISLQDL